MCLLVFSVVFSFVTHVAVNVGGFFSAWRLFILLAAADPGGPGWSRGWSWGDLLGSETPRDSRAETHVEACPEGLGSRMVEEISSTWS